MKEGSSHFNWVVVGINFITLGITYSTWYSFSVFFVALLKEFQWQPIYGRSPLLVLYHRPWGGGTFCGGNWPIDSEREGLSAGSLFLGEGSPLAV